MAKRLIKIAKELNVGTSTIVEHLLNKGFEIDNKPTSKVTDEMYETLLLEFQNSVAIKEKADSLIIGNRIPPKKDAPAITPPKETSIFKTPPPAPPAPVEEEEIVEEIVEEIPVVEETPEPIVEEPAVELEVEEKPKVGLKILGKVDLDAKKPKPTPPTEETPVAEEVAPVAEEVVQPEEKVEPTPSAEPVAKVEAPKETPTESPSPEAKKEEAAPEETASKPESTMMRAKTPQLKGLKILGKIDADKLKKPKKKKKPEKTASGEGDKAKTGTSTGDPTKRKRKRKKVTVSNSNNSRGSSPGGGNNRNNNRGGGNNRSGGGGRRRDEVKEVSQKEIDEKIKQTMARLKGGGKRTRQKLRRDNRERIREKQEQIEASKETGKLQLTEFVSVSELASLMDVPVSQVITTCMNLGVIVSINQRLDAEIIELVAEEFGNEVEFISAEEEVVEEEEIVDAPEDLKPRAPIVTVMGHVDHGKTSLLDYIRSANVMDGEAGGITQHIGAYEVEVGDDKKKITFLDTPGHEAFTAMRARGAKVTDVAVIIIAADDSIMPQTREAISHAQAANVPMVFAINKIDKDGSQPEKIKQELASMNFLVEDWGGSYQSQDISAKTGLNVDLLLEKIILESELLELQANPDRAAIGAVIEASLDKGRGFVTKVLIQTGNLSIGTRSKWCSTSRRIFQSNGKRTRSPTISFSSFSNCERASHTSQQTN